MDSPRFNFDGPAFGDDVHDERELKEMAAELDEEDPGWADDDDDGEPAGGVPDAAAQLDDAVPPPAVDDEPHVEDVEMDAGDSAPASELDQVELDIGLDDGGGEEVADELPGAGSDEAAPKQPQEQQPAIDEVAAPAPVEGELEASAAQPHAPEDRAPPAAPASEFLNQPAPSSPGSLASQDEQRSRDGSSAAPAGRLAALNDWAGAAADDEEKDDDKEDKDEDEAVVPPPPPAPTPVPRTPRPVARQPSIPPTMPSSSSAPRAAQAPSSVSSPAARSASSRASSPATSLGVSSPTKAPAAAKTVSAAGFAEDESEQEDESEDDGESEAEEERPAGPRRAKKRKVNSGRNRFIEDEAEVDEDDEEFDEEDADYAREAEEFIDEDDGKGAGRGKGGHQRLDRRQREDDDQDAEVIAARIREKHQHQQARVYVGDDENLPQGMLVPSVDDPKLWQVRVKPGREKQLVFSIMRKSIDLEYTDAPLRVFSAFQRESLPGILYVEANNRAAVEDALDGLIGVYLTKGIHLVPIDEMPALLKLTQKRVEIAPGSWVRIKRGRYRGDLAQVIDLSDNGEEAGLRFVPRIDLDPRHLVQKQDGSGTKVKRKRGQSSAPGVRPPAKFFSSDAVAKVYGKRSAVPRRDGYVVFQGDTYKDGFIEKDIKVGSIETHNVVPTVEEAVLFGGEKCADDDDDAHLGEDFRTAAEKAHEQAMAGLQSGDVVEVTHDQNKGAAGTVITVADGIVRLRRTNGENAGAELTVRAEFLKKLFRPGEHVKVMAGKNLDETGLVLEIQGDFVTFLSDRSLQEVTVFAKDVRVAAEVGSGLNAVDRYQLHDIVPLGGGTQGLIIRIERHRLDVIDTQGKTQSIQPHQVSTGIHVWRDADAYDSQGQPMRRGETVVEVDGGEGRSGVILAVRGLAVFVYNRNIALNEGVFVVSPRSLISLAAAHATKPQSDLAKLNPEIGQYAPLASGIRLQTRRFHDPLLDTPVVVVKGIHKSRIGRITDVNGEVCRVELQSTNQTITVKKDGLLRKDPKTGATGPLPTVRQTHTGVDYRQPTTPLASPLMKPGSVNPYANDGGRSLAFNGSRTVTPHGSSATPGGVPWGFDAGTPGPASSGRTPAYVALQGARTPTHGGILGARTPGKMSVQGGRTPAYVSALAGARTPAYVGGGAGGRTPAYGALAGGWTPADSASGRSQSAATPLGAGAPSSPAGPSKREATTSYVPPTPDFGLTSAPTPGTYQSAPTPSASHHATYAAPTPGSSLDEWDWVGGGERPNADAVREGGGRE